MYQKRCNATTKKGLKKRGLDRTVQIQILTESDMAMKRYMRMQVVGINGLVESIEEERGEEMRFWGGDSV